MIRKEIIRLEQELHKQKRRLARREAKVSAFFDVLYPKEDDE